MSIRVRVLRAMRRRGRERGTTLIELLVTMILLGVVSTLVVGAVVQSSRVLTHTDDEEKGLQDAKVILDRLGRDVREAREVVCDGGLADPTDPGSTDVACQAHLQVWIDSNSDYVREPTEVVTWRLVRNGGHYDVWRVVGNGSGGSPVTSHREATTLILNIAFTYNPGPFASVNQVNLLMTYDAIASGGSAPRDVAFSARLRNKG